MMRQREIPISEVGRTILNIVRERPGIHFRGLGRAARLSSVGQLRHHLDRLRRSGLLLEVEEGRYKRFFLAGAHRPDMRPVMARFARPVPRRIGKLLLNRPMNRTELRQALGCADSTLGYHLSRMMQLGDLCRNRTRSRSLYELADPDLVRQVLAMDGHGEEARLDDLVETSELRAQGGNGDGAPMPDAEELQVTRPNGANGHEGTNGHDAAHDEDGHDSNGHGGERPERPERRVLVRPVRST